MAEIILTQNQIEDAQSKVLDARSSFDRYNGSLHDPTTVPRPLFAEVAAGLEDAARFTKGRLLLTGADKQLTARFAGLRAVAHFVAGNGAKMQCPAVVLVDGQHVAALMAESNPRSFSALTHALLENEYVTQRADISAHTDDNRIAPAVGGHALVAASFVDHPQRAHDKVHRLDDDMRGFGVAFGGQGEERRDFLVGHDKRRVRSAVLPLAKVVLEVRAEYQLPPDELLLGTGMDAGELNVAMVAAATLSRQDEVGTVDIRANMHAMAEAR